MGVRRELAEAVLCLTPQYLLIIKTVTPFASPASLTSLHDCCFHSYSRSSVSEDLLFEDLKETKPQQRYSLFILR